MRTSLFAFVLLSGCVQRVDVGFEYSAVTQHDGGEETDAGTDAGVMPHLESPCAGAIFISTTAEWAAFAAAQCVTVYGDLVIRGDQAADLTDINDAVLETVTGQFRIVGSQVHTATFQELRSAGVVDVALNGVLETVDLPKLTTSTRLNLVFNGALRELNAPRLSDLGGADITMNDKLTVLNFASLTSVQGQLTISNNAMLRQCVADGIFAGLAVPPAQPSSSGNGGTPNVCP